jgi:hypothetical protein
MKFRHCAVLAAFVLAAAGPLASSAVAQVLTAARDVEPVILTGAELPAWTRLPAEVTCAPYPSGTTGGRDAHNGTTTVPPDARTGAAVDQIAAYRWGGSDWVEIPVQVDEMFIYCLSNPPSDFALYSGTDRELSYAWDVESWKKTAGQCVAAYPSGEGPTPDPVPTLDNDDEVVFMARDAGPQAPSGATPPGATDVLPISIADPLNLGPLSYVYLVLKPGGSSFDAASGYVSYVRDANADEWIDRYSIAADDPEILGVSNTGYGPNLAGDVCRTAVYPGYPAVADGTPRASTDRFPRDGVTVATDIYRWRATGRWMVRDVRITAPSTTGIYGPDLLDRWKGRAFQQAPDSTISLVGFEDEQVNWEANSALIGERAGPVRALRETWGADSGTNVTKLETFYRDVVTYRYHVRVHPIPPDGLYTSWDYNRGVATTYYNTLNSSGVAIDGENDDQGNIDGLGNFPAYFDAADPLFSGPSALLNWEQVSGGGNAGSLVYITEIKGATTAENPAVVPYYRDDSCLDDGTGDDPLPRPWPGEAGSDQRVLDGYCAANGQPAGCHVCRLRSDPGPCDVDCKLGETQGAHAAHGVHYFFSNDTDNAASPGTLTEIDAQQWQFMVPTAAPTNVGQHYGNVVIVPLVAVPLEVPGVTTTTTPTTTSTSTTMIDRCCVAGGCLRINPPGCAEAGGIPMGDGSCEPNPCPTTTTVTPPSSTTTTTLAGGNLNVIQARLRSQSAPGAGNGSLRAQGDFTTPPAFTFPPSFTVRVQDGLGLDRTHTFSGPCRILRSGKIICRESASDGRFSADFTPIRRNPGAVRFRVSFARQAVSGPFAAPVTVTVTHNSGVVRTDSISDCRAVGSGLMCRES